MSTPYELEKFVLILSDRGVAVPSTHANSHRAAGADPLVLTRAQISDLGSIAGQNSNAVTITGGSVANVTLTSGNATITGGAISGASLNSAAATLTGGTINSIVIGGTTPAAGTFTALVANSVSVSGTLTIGSLALAAPLPVAQGGTGASNQAGAQAALGLGSMAMQSANAVTITGGSATGLTVCGTTGVTSFIGTSLSLTGAVGSASVNTTTLNVFGTASINSLVLTNPLLIGNGGTGATSASAARTALGLAIGTDVQAFNANLAALAGLTGAADQLPYFTGAGAMALQTLSSFVRSTFGSASATAFLSALGIELGTATLGAVTPGMVDVTLAGVTAGSRIFAIHTGSISGAVGVLSATPGTGTFTINSLTSVGALETGDANDVFYLVIK
jgi:hypothetical protein